MSVIESNVARPPHALHGDHSTIIPYKPKTDLMPL
jgi:hypothetical protein